MLGASSNVGIPDLLDPRQRMSGREFGLNMIKQQGDALVDVASQGVYTGGAQGSELGQLGSLVSSFAPETYAPGQIVNFLS